MAALEAAFHKASSKFKISELNAYQKLAIRKFDLEKEDIFVNLPTGSGKSLIYQAMPLVYESLAWCQRAETLDNSDRFVVSVIGSHGHN